ncbi:MAG: glycine cleavage system protein GcvH [Clostridiales bacterium]|jgi:glycine cleavage system H protein|nr:glycine cleavage system protein GcvH [Bacillota bacterium]NLK04610.1 glycine cleavage system protein GcvH [Clostridiales bacterium]
MSKEIFYAKSHEWVEFLDDNTARIGISDYAQNEMGDLVFIGLPEDGDEVEVGESFADVESVKAVSNVYSPVTGTIKAVNEELLDQPELVNSSAMESWFIEVENITNRGQLMTEEEYNKYIAE